MLVLVLNYRLNLQRFKFFVWKSTDPITVLMKSLTVIRFCWHTLCNLWCPRMLSCFSPDLFWSSNTAIQVCKLRWGFATLHWISDFWTHWPIDDAVDLMSVELFRGSHSKTVFLVKFYLQDLFCLASSCFPKIQSVANVE